jgi:hypothetical protein
VIFSSAETQLKNDGDGLRDPHVSRIFGFTLSPPGPAPAA